MWARAAVVWAIVGWTSLVRADDAADRHDKAAELSRQAFRLIDDTDFAGASDVFMQAYELSKELPHLLNASVALRKAHLPHLAVRALHRYLDDAGPALAADMRAQLEGDIAEIIKDSARATVTTTGDAIEVTLDLRAAGTASKAAALVVLIAPEAGKDHVLRGHREGFTDDERHVGALVPGRTLEVVLDPKVRLTTGTLRVTSVPPGAALFDHGKPIGRAGEPIVVAPGHHEVFARLDGYEEERGQITVDAGATSDLTLHLRRIQASWWARHKTLLVVTGVVLAGAGGVLIREQLRPDYGFVIHY